MKKNSVRRFYPVRERSKASTKVENKALKRRKSVGQGLVEFALVAPLLLLTIFGIIDIARIIQAQITVDNAARQAIRFAVTGQTLKDAGGNYIPRATSITDLAVAGLAGLPLTNTDDPLQWGFNRVRITSSNGDEGDPGQDISCRSQPPPTSTPCGLCPTATPSGGGGNNLKWFIQGKAVSFYDNTSSGKVGDIFHAIGLTVVLDR